MMQRPGRFRRPLGPPRVSARDQVLAAWRGVHLRPKEVARAKTGRPAAQLLPNVMKGLHLDRRRTDAEIGKVWNSLIDPTLTAHAQPTGIHNGTLFVSVDSSVWLDEIVRYRRRDILNRLQHSFGAEYVRRISFRLG